MSQVEQVREMFGIERRRDWQEMSAENFESTLFVELKQGDEFIFLPTPGDNKGHGGFRSGFQVFKKIEPVEMHNTKIVINTIRLTDGFPVSFPPELAVVKLNR